MKGRCLPAILLLFLPLFVQADPIELQVPNAVLIQQLKAGTNRWVIPVFEVYNAKGIRTYHHVGDFGSDPNAILSQAINAKVENQTLDDRLADLKDADGKPYRVKNTAQYDEIFVEYWASWCEPCHQQMKQVREFISKHPKLKILWIKVEQDPTKLDNIQMQ